MHIVERMLRLMVPVIAAVLIDIHTADVSHQTVAAVYNCQLGVMGAAMGCQREVAQDESGHCKPRVGRIWE